MNWDDVRIFLSVARKGSLTAAAQALDMSPSSVGRHIENLEVQLGARMFIRSQTGYALSDAGLAMMSSKRKLFWLFFRVNNVGSDLPHSAQ